MPIIIMMMKMMIIVDECFMVWKIIFTQIINVGGWPKKMLGPQNVLIEVLVLEQVNECAHALVFRGKMVMGERKRRKG